MVHGMLLLKKGKKNLNPEVPCMKYKKVFLGISLIIAALNLFDGFITHFGLELNAIEEANPIMHLLWSTSPTMFLVLKVALSVFISIISYLVYKKSAVPFQKMFSVALVSIGLLYSGIFSLHIFWLSLL